MLTQILHGGSVEFHDNVRTDYMQRRRVLDGLLEANASTGAARTRQIPVLSTAVPFDKGAGDSYNTHQLGAFSARSACGVYGTPPVEVVTGLSAGCQ